MVDVYLLDTNILIAALKGHPRVRQQLEVLPLSRLRLSAIVLGELAFGAEKSAQGDRNRARLSELANRLPLVGVDHRTVVFYAQVRAALERRAPRLAQTTIGSQPRLWGSAPRWSRTMNVSSVASRG